MSDLGPAHIATRAINSISQPTVPQADPLASKQRAKSWQIARNNVTIKDIRKQQFTNDVQTTSADHNDSCLHSPLLTSSIVRKHNPRVIEGGSGQSRGAHNSTQSYVSAHHASRRKSKLTVSTVQRQHVRHRSPW